MIFYPYKMRRNVASLGVYFYGCCSWELRHMVPSLLTLSRITSDINGLGFSPFPTNNQFVELVAQLVFSKGFQREFV